MLPRNVRTIVVAGVILGGMSANARAQDVAHTFDQLRVLVRAGDTLTVTDAAGHETTGKVADLSSASLALMASDGRRTLTSTEVTTIRRRRHGNLGKGAKVGFGVGAGLALVSIAGGGDGCHNCGGFLVAATLIEGAVGAGIGVGVSAATTHQQMIFASPTAPSAPSAPSATTGRLTVAPVVTRQRQALMVSFGF
jgi:hypothetical protein